MSCPLTKQCWCWTNRQETCTLCDRFKVAWLWVIGGEFGFYTNKEKAFLAHDLFFSSKERFLELLGRPMQDDEAIIRVWVEKDFDDWDYIPDCY